MHLPVRFATLFAWLVLLGFSWSVFPVAAQVGNRIAPPGGSYPPTIPPTGCGTAPMDSVNAYYQPYYGNNQYLLDLVAQIEGTSGCTSCRTNTGGMAPETFKIPVRVWMYQNDQGIGGLADNQVEELINLMNARARNTGLSVRFYLKTTITRIRHTGYYEQIDGERTGFGTSYGSTNMMEEHIDGTALNVHIIRTNRDDFGGRARRPNDSAHYSFAVVTAGYLDLNDMAGTMLHEAGHCFDLSHTHESARNSLASNNANASACYQEAVSRNRQQGFGCFGTNGEFKCSVNGDLLCDTDADPQLSDSKVDAACNYTAGGSDRWGDAWNPPTRNVMSYSLRGCRSILTSMQRGVIYHYIREYKTGWRLEPAGGGGFVLYPPEPRSNPMAFYQNTSVDRYENDNYWQQANTIQFDESQLHAFHAQPGSNDPDVDWVRFTATSSGPVSISTSGGYSPFAPDTRLTLFAGDGVTLLATNDNLSGSSTFSRIDLASLTPGNTYFVRVENLSASGTPAFTGQYRLNLFECFDQIGSDVQGPNTLCPNSSTASATYSVGNLPAGSTVTWSITPAGVANLSSTTGTSTYVTAQSYGYATLTATVNTGACTVSLPGKNIVVGGGSTAGTYYCTNCSSSGTLYTYQSVQPGYYTVVMDPGDYTFASASASVPITKTSSNRATFYLPSGGGTQINVTANNATTGCAATGSYVFFNSIYGYRYSPNPVNDFLTVEVEQQNPTTAKFVAEAQSQSQSKSASGSVAKPVNEMFVVELYDNYGRQLTTQRGTSSQLKLDVRSYPSGLYNLRIIHAGEVQNRHLQITH